MCHNEFMHYAGQRTHRQYTQTIHMNHILWVCSVMQINPLRAADFSAHLSRATEGFSQNN